MNCGVGHIAVSVTPIRPLACEPPYATGMALKSKKKSRKNKNRREYPKCEANAKGKINKTQGIFLGSENVLWGMQW